MLQKALRLKLPAATIIHDEDGRIQLLPDGKSIRLKNRAAKLDGMSEAEK